MSRIEGRNGKQNQTLTNNSMMIIEKEPISRLHTYIMRVTSSCCFIRYSLKEEKKEIYIHQWFSSLFFFIARILNMIKKDWFKKQLFFLSFFLFIIYVILSFVLKREIVICLFFNNEFLMHAALFYEQWHASKIN